MAARKKPDKRRKVKQEKAKREATRQLTETEAKELVGRLIAQGKPKEALQTLQQIPFADAAEMVFLKALAYGRRARQLQSKGLEREAATVIDLLSGHLSKMGSISCSQLAEIIAAAPVSFAVPCYLRHSQKHPSCPPMERALADLMIIEKGWELARELPEDNPIRQDAPAMMEAANEMTQARWEEGLAKLDTLSRKSPFAPWKLFAKAMVSAYKGAEEDLERALRQLPEDFLLDGTVRILREKGCKGLEEIHVWACRSDWAQAEAVVKAIQGQDRDLPGLISQLAKRLFPSHPGMALNSLAEATAHALSKRRIDWESIRRLLPQDVSKALLVRLQMLLGTRREEDVQPFCHAQRYLKVMDGEFPRAQDRDKVEAELFFLLLGQSMMQNRLPRLLHPRDKACLTDWLEMHQADPPDLLVAAVDKITRLAPEVADYHKLLGKIEVSLLSSLGMERLEKVLLRVQEHFPEDPFAYIELAKLYWKSNAYRKSQKVLEEAWKKASYDPRVREFYGLGLLRAAVKSRNRRSFDLCRKDIEKAKALNLKDLMPVTLAIEATLAFLEKGKENQPIESLLALPDPVLRLRALTCFHADLGQVDTMGTKSLARDARIAAQNDLKSRLQQMKESDLVELTAPYSREAADLLQDIDVLGFFDSLWPSILRAMSDQRVLTAYAQLLGVEPETKQYVWVEKDLKARLRTQRKNVFFRFYSVLLGYLKHDSLDPDVFEDFVKKLGEDEKRRLSELCRKIAPHFEPPLRGALEEFDFELLYEEDGWFDPVDEDEDEDEDYDSDWEDDDLEEGEDPIGAILDGFKKLGGDRQVVAFMVEMLVAELKTKGADEDDFREIGFELEHRDRRVMDALRQSFSGKTGRKPSREVRWVLYPDRD